MLETDYLTPVTVQIQGVRAQFSSSLRSLHAFARSHFPEREQGTTLAPAAQLSAGLAEIEAHVQWIEGGMPQPAYAAISPGRMRLDRDIEIGEGELAWTRLDDFNAFQLRFALEENRLHLHGQHFFSLSRASLRNHFKKALHWKRLPTLREKRFSTVLYYTMYYPAFWWLEHKGLFPLHAAAVELAGSGVVLCGLPGCGKSTLSLALLSLPEARLLSDNIIFFDRERVFRCPEPILVDDRSLRLIGEGGALLHSLGRRHAYGRAWYHLPPDCLVDQTVPRLWLFVGLGQQSGLRPLSYPETMQRFAAVNWIALELRRYLVYRSVLGHLRPVSLWQGHGDESLVRELSKQGQCYELIVSWNDGIHKALDHVCKLVDTVRS